MHENSDLVRLVINSIRKDLDEMNETNNCLALHAIANIGGAEMAEALAGDVHRLLISPCVYCEGEGMGKGELMDVVQDFALVCQEKGGAHAAEAVSQACRGHSGC